MKSMFNRTVELSKESIKTYFKTLAVYSVVAVPLLVGISFIGAYAEHELEKKTEENAKALADLFDNIELDDDEED